MELPNYWLVIIGVITVSKYWALFWYLFVVKVELWKFEKQFDLEDT